MYSLEKSRVVCLYVSVLEILHNSVFSTFVMCFVCVCSCLCE